MKTLFAVLSFLFVLQAFPAKAQLAPEDVERFLKTWFPFLYGEQKGPGPEDTLIAPFASDEVKAEGESNIERLPVNNVPMETTHKSYEEIREWLIEAVGQAMSFDYQAAESQVILIENKFSPAALDQYKEFIESTRVKEKVLAMRGRISSYVTESPSLINEGAVEGRYRWLFDVPLFVSFMEADARSAATANTETYSIKLRIQIGRVNPDVQPEGLIIENWKSAGNFREANIE